MRRRFGRGRRRGGDGGGRGNPIDGGPWFARAVEAGLVEGPVEPLAHDGIPDHFAALATASGGERLLALCPGDGGAAWLAGLALGVSRASEGFAGEVLALAPEWSGATRRRISLAGALPFTLRALGTAAPDGAPRDITPERVDDTFPVPPAQVAAGLASPGDRELFMRTLAALEGLAAKHGGAVRGVAGRVELVLLARRVAVLEARGGRLVLETLVPERSILELGGDGFATSMDRLEGLLRKRLNDRKVRGSEDGLRGDLLPVLERAGGLVSALPWPLPGSDPEALDLAGVTGDGTPVVAAAREKLGLPDLGVVLDAALDARAALPLLLAGRSVGIRPGSVRLLLAAREFDGIALSALAGLSLGCEAYEVRQRRTGELGLERLSLEAVPVAQSSAAATSPSPEQPSEPPIERPTERPTEQPPERPPARRGRTRSASAASESAAEPSRRETRRPEPEDGPPTPAVAHDASESSGGFEEVSLFDLDDDRSSGDGASRRGRGRGRGRRRGRRGRAGGDAAEPTGTVTDAPNDAPGEGGAQAAHGDATPERADDRDREAGRGRRGRRGRRDRPPAARQAEDAEPAESADPDDELLGSDDDEATLAPIPEDAPDLEGREEPAYEDEDEGDEADAAADRARRERERRRRARLAKTEPDEPPRAPRRRAAFVAHADRLSVMTAVLLARDVRLVEGFWVYPQEDLMTFFRSIATDLRDGTPIFLVGFTASPPARDTLQAASLYSGRLDWFDHHDWPPEDLEALREAIGADHVHIQPGGESSVPEVVRERTRRSRFSDKLVELVSGRFSQHDYERWGRLWWHRVAEIAERRGERRADVDALLTGRPSDLAREASRVPTPPVPPEHAFVTDRDFRVVHFGGFVLVVLEVPPELDLHLTARIARERFDAQLSLAMTPGSELLVLSGDEARSRRGLDLGGMTAHLAAKHEWIEALPDDDHVARMRVRGLTGDASRLDEVITEIAMGRSIIEG